LNNDQAFFYNSGGVIYKGVEAEGTLVIGAGFSLYANASINSARLKSDDTWVPLTPNETGVIGLLFKQGPLQASLIDKYVGVRYGDAEDYYRFGGYSTVDASFNYLIGQWAALKAAKIGVTVQNLTNNKSLYVLDGYSGSSSTAFGANGVPLLFTLPGISVEVNLSASF
jgi:iron complex outermembrane receptor protein